MKDKERRKEYMAERYTPGAMLGLLMGETGGQHKRPVQESWPEIVTLEMLALGWHLGTRWAHFLT